VSINIHVVVSVCHVMLLQSGLSEPDKEEKPTSDSDGGYSKDLVLCFLLQYGWLCNLVFERYWLRNEFKVLRWCR